MASPTGSVRSSASCGSGTLSRPPPPSKPSHLSSAFTGTRNSIALRHYIQTHTTGGSFTTHSPSTATISRARLGHGYDSSSADHFVDAFDTCSDDEDLARSTSRPSARGRTYTAPSVSSVFPSCLSSEGLGSGGNDTARLIRNDPVFAIDGSGPSRVSNLRGMFEAAIPSASTPTALSRQNTGIASQHTGTRVKPRISNQVRMLQAQITGDRFNGLAGAFNVAETRSSIIVETPHKTSTHWRDSTDQSQDESRYRTATSDLLGDALKMDAVVIPPDSNADTIKAVSSSRSLPFMMHDSERFGSAHDGHASTLPADSLTASRIGTITAQHQRDDSSATIRPSRSDHDVAGPLNASKLGTISSSGPIPGTTQRPSTRLVSGDRKGRLSSIFTTSPQSSSRDHSTGRNAEHLTSSSSGLSFASQSASEAPTEAERSREPSMLIDDDDDNSFTRMSHHLRANDGSCFDLDPRASNTSPCKAASVRRALLPAAPTGDVGKGSDGLAPLDGEPLTISILPHTRSDPTAEISPSRSPSIVIDAKLNESAASAPATDAGGHDTVAPSGRGATLVTESTLLVTRTASTLQGSRPNSARMPHPGTGKSVRALYDFEGEAAFNELTVRAGQSFEILNEQLAGGWSLGVVWGDDGLPTRGLIPQGWYCHIQDFTRSPLANLGTEPASTPDILGLDHQADVVHLPPAASASPHLSSSQTEVDGGPAAVSLRGEQGSSKHLREQTCTKGVDQSSASPIIDVVVPSQYSPNVSDQAPNAANPSSPRPASVESNFSISVSAFLRTDEPASQRPQADMAAADIDVVAEELPTICPSPKLVIDGMPAASTEDNPIDWSVVNSSPSPPDVGKNVPIESVLEPQSVAPSSDANQNAATTGIAGSDWKGSILGKKTFNRFASFVTSGAEDYVLSESTIDDDERTRNIARKVSGARSMPANVSPLAGVAEEDDDEGVIKDESRPQANPNGCLALSATVSEIELSAADPNQHFVVAGPAGPKWKSKSAPFLVQVHHPEKRTKLNGMQEYTIYYVTSTYPIEDQQGVLGNHGCIPYDPLGGPYPPGGQVTVVRRFTQFEWLYSVLVKHYSALLIPPLPEKQYSGRFASDFIETRRADLEMWISRLVRHPVLRYSEPIRFFLSCQDEAGWRRYSAELFRDGHIAQSGTGQPSKGGVFAQTWHPEFNFDSSEAALEADRVDSFLRALETTVNGVGGHNAGKQGLLAAYKGHREGNVATSSNYRDLSYTLLRTLTGAGAGPSDGCDSEAEVTFGGEEAHRIHGPPMGNVGRRSETGATNEHGAWCWREDCQDCLNLTSALQNTAECMQTVADIYESHARETLLRQHERFKEVSRPHTTAQSLLETHRTTLARYREATESDIWDDDHDDNAGGGARGAVEEADKVAARCETVINVTLSEMDRLHDERVQDYHALGRSFLDGEIELYESILEQLKASRLHFDAEYYERDADYHVLASRYQRELSRPRKPTAPLLMPSAAQGPPGGLRGVGLLLSQATGRSGGVGGVSDRSLASAGTESGSGVVGKKAQLQDSTNMLRDASEPTTKTSNKDTRQSHFTLWR